MHHGECDCCKVGNIRKGKIYFCYKIDFLPLTSLKLKCIFLQELKRSRACRRYSLPCGTPCFVVVSAFTRVTLWYYSSFEGWVSLFCNLGPTLGTLPSLPSPFRVSPPSTLFIYDSFAISFFCVHRGILFFKENFHSLKYIFLNNHFSPPLSPSPSLPFSPSYHSHRVQPNTPCACRYH